MDLQLEVERLRLVVEQLQAEGRKHEEENRSLLRNLQQVQGRCQEKIKVCLGTCYCTAENVYTFQ